MRNFVEELVAEYYKTKGYFVATNFWLPFQSQRQRIQLGAAQDYEARSWTDIDVLARNETVLKIIQVKAIINSKSVAENVVRYFERVDKFIQAGLAPDGKSDIFW